MKKFMLSAISATFILTLSACGSGGGNDSSSPLPITHNATPQSTGNTSSKQSSANKPSEQSSTNKPLEQSNTNTSSGQPNTNITEEQTSPSVSDKLLENTGINIDRDNYIKGEIPTKSIENTDGKEIAKLSGYNRKYSFNGALMKSKDNITSMIVDGVFIKVANKVEESLGGIKGRALSKALITAYNVSKDPERDIFYFGDETPVANIPKAGKATYIGNATRYDNLNAKVQNVGTSELTADFDNKKIQGELKMDGLRRNITLEETDIQGNGFKGKAIAGQNSVFITRTGEYEGKFFGPNAEEVAGKATFAQKDLNTSFSSEKVE